jgi:hypothetical protein
MTAPQFTELDLEDAYAAGRADAHRELLPFHGVGRVAFPTDREQFDAAVLYEQRLLQEHRWVLSLLYEDAFTENQARARLGDMHREVSQRVAAAEARGSNRVSSTARRLYAVASSQGTLQDAERHAREVSEDRASRKRLAARLLAELADVRSWLDDRVDAASAYAQKREGLRRDSDPLHGLRMYDDHADFVAEDREGREALSWPGEPGGASYGVWTWEDPERPWIERRYACYWLDNGEIYAWDLRGSSLPATVPLPGRERDKQPVILLGRVPRARVGSAEDFLGQLQAAVTGRNTLVVLEEAVAEQERLQRRRRAIGADEDDAASDVA